MRYDQQQAWNAGGENLDSVYSYSVSFIMEEEMLSNTPVWTKVFNRLKVLDMTKENVIVYTLRF